MARGTLSERVERLELTVQGLEGLPGEVAGLRRDVASLGDRMTGAATQILQLRTEMRGEFSAVREEMRIGLEGVKTELREEIRGEIGSLRGEMHEGFAAARDDLLLGLEMMRSDLTRDLTRNLTHDLTRNLTHDLGQQIRETAEEGKRHSRVLFEELVSRIATLGEHPEGWPARKPRAPRRKR
jgi:hypothetical protein